MKFFSHGAPGREHIGVLVDDDAYDLTPLTGDAPALDRAFLEADGIERTRAELAAGRLSRLAASTLDGARRGAPLHPGKILCIGLNYRDHAAETGAPIPPEPIVFMKSPDTVVGPDDAVLIPRGSQRTDWEVELAVVIGSTLRYARDEQEAMGAVAGYAVSHDVSEREFQLERGGTWDKGKNCETFNPLGPWLVTADEVADPQALRLHLEVNGEVRQDGTTADQIFTVGEVVRYLSHFMTLYPGDVINTGTPAGVAMGLPGQPYLRAGDVVDLGIEGLGTQCQTVRDA